MKYIKLDAQLFSGAYDLEKKVKFILVKEGKIKLDDGVSADQYLSELTCNRLYNFIFQEANTDQNTKGFMPNVPKKLKTFSEAKILRKIKDKLFYRDCDWVDLGKDEFEYLVDKFIKNQDETAKNAPTTLIDSLVGIVEMIERAVKLNEDEKLAEKAFEEGKTQSMKTIKQAYEEAGFEVRLVDANGNEKNKNENDADKNSGESPEQKEQQDTVAEKPEASDTAKPTA